MSGRYERDAELAEAHFGRQSGAIEQLMTQTGEDHFKTLTVLRERTTNSTRARIRQAATPRVAVANM